MPPAKKAAKPVRSLSDMLNNTETETAPEENAPEESIYDENVTNNLGTNTTPVDQSTDDAEKSSDIEDNSDGALEDAAAQDENPANDELLQPDGVAFSGRENVINKTPSDMAAETPEESARRFGISSDIPDSVHDNPNIKATRDNQNFQVQSGTHLHPDIARDNYNRSLDESNETASVTTSSSRKVYADEAEVDDKGRKGYIENDSEEFVQE